MIVGIINTGVANFASLERMLVCIGVSTRRVSVPRDFVGVDSLILPGVGHFDSGMRALNESNLADTLREVLSKSRTPVLGICLGMQLLCRVSEEGTVPGLNLVDAEVKRFKFTPENELKIPHMGWNIVRTTSPNLLIPECEEVRRFYFVHSYRVIPKSSSLIIGTANYGIEFCAAFQQNNIFGVQFHPEKSHRFGLELMKRFVAL